MHRTNTSSRRRIAVAVALVTAGILLTGCAQAGAQPGEPTAGVSLAATAGAASTAGPSKAPKSTRPSTSAKMTTGSTKPARTGKAGKPGGAPKAAPSPAPSTAGGKPTGSGSTGSSSAGSKPTGPKPIGPKPTGSNPSAERTTAADRNGLPGAKCGDVVDQLAKARQQILDSSAGAAAGIVLVRRDAPRCTASASGDETFATASVVKLLIAIEVLRANGSDPDVAERVTRMLRLSDDDIASDYWARYGGPQIINDSIKLMNLTSLTAPADDPGEWGSTRIDALDVARIWQYVLDDAPASVRDPILAGTGGATRIAGDGTDQYFGIPDGLPNATWWIKQGWGTSKGRRVINTTGLIGKNHDAVLVVLTSHPTSIGYQTCKQAATEAVSALAGALGES
jgi:hypothetical protein